MMFNSDGIGYKFSLYLLLTNWPNIVINNSLFKIFAKGFILHMGVYQLLKSCVRKDFITKRSIPLDMLLSMLNFSEYIKNCVKI